MAGVLQPLVDRMSIVNADGTPTQYFIRWAQQRQIDISGSITAAEALTIATDYVADFMAAHPLNEGTGIQITPSGNIADGITISADVQAILDEISTAQGTILFRGAADWQALAPGTAGYFLQTGGASADPAWAAASGGAGGLTVIGDIVLGAAASSFNFASIPGTYKDLMIAWSGAGTVEEIVIVQFNGDTGANYDFDRTSRAGSSVVTGTASPQVGLCNAAPASVASSFEATVPNYAGVIFQKAGNSRISFKDDTSSSGVFVQNTAWFWRNTAAINQVTVLIGSGSFLAGSRCTLYGRG